MGSGDHSAFRDVPAIYRQLVPELAELGVDEELRADCARCPMVDAGEFRAESRCCTYHPAMANFLVGRALERGGLGAARLVERLNDLDGVSAWGIYPRRDEHRRYVATRDTAFGNDQSLRCPYWVGGVESCGVWLERPSVCRTWFCKHEQGEGGALLWQAVEAAIWQVENRLAFLLADDAAAPTPGRGDAAAFAAWFRECARRLDRVDAAALEHEAIADARAELSARVAAYREPMPDIVVPSVAEVAPLPAGHLRVVGYSSFDWADAPRAIYQVLARLDGETTWRDAIADTEVTEADIRDLFRVGALCSARRL